MNDNTSTTTSAATPIERLTAHMTATFGANAYSIDQSVTGQIWGIRAGTIVGVVKFTTDVPALRRSRMNAIRRAGFIVKPWRDSAYVIEPDAVKQ